MVLQNGRVFEGYRFGADASPIGELVFTTGMGGYIETLTDPSYYGQIILQTFPLIGNYGMIYGDMESAGCYAKAYIVREWCDAPSNFRCEGSLDDYLKKSGIPGLYGVDTREIAKEIRTSGAMNAAIVDQPTPEVKKALGEYAITGALQAVSCKAAQTFHANGQQKYRVALMDYGTKRNIVEELCKRGCQVTVLPHDTPAEHVLALKPDGVMLSNGPGDPADNPFVIAQIAKLMGKLPVFGICLGHQLMALAQGGSTVKLKYGHHGVNQPVKDLQTGRIYITSQNHNYAALPEGVAAGGGQLRMVNANDQTCEGIDYPALSAYSVQFHPEACSGPLDTQFLFERFIALMGGEGHGA